MRKALGLAFYILAGCFVYVVCLLAFVTQTTMAKWEVVAGCSLFTLFFLCIGLSVNRFQRWKRDVGVVLLSGAGVTAFIVFSSVCFLTTEEFKKIIQPSSLEFFDAYVSGFIFMLSVVALGILFLKTEKKSVE